MDNKIIVVNKVEFENYFKKNYYTDTNIDDFDLVPNMVFISINDWATTFNTAYFREDHKNVLNLMFDDVSDVDERNANVKAFDHEMAIKLFEFIENNKDKDFMIHCSAGISRSGAVGTFILEYLHGDKEFFEDHNSHILPNQHVLKTMNNLINGYATCDFCEEEGCAFINIDPYESELFGKNDYVLICPQCFKLRQDEI